MSLKIGWSEKSITPDKTISLVGQFAERISEYVEKPLTVTALAIDSGDDQVVMVSCDLGSVSWNLLQDVRARLADNDVGLDPQKIYHCPQLDLTASGALLMNAGINMTEIAPWAYSSAKLHFIAK